MFYRSSNRRWQKARRLSTLALLSLGLVGPAQAGTLPFDLTLEIAEKAIAPDLELAAGWDSQEVGALFFSLQKSSDLAGEPGAPCGIVDPGAQSILGQTVGYLELAARAKAVVSGVADIEGLHGACTVADIEGLATADGVADIDGLWVRVDLVDLGGGIWSRTVPGDKLAWGHGLSAKGWNPEIEPRFVDQDLGPWRSAPDGPMLEALIETPDGIEEVAYVVDGDWAVADGHVVLGTAAEVAKASAELASGRHSKGYRMGMNVAWPGATVRYQFAPEILADPAFTTIANRMRVAAAAWSDIEESPLRILECPPSTPGGFPDCAGLEIEPYLQVEADDACRSTTGWRGQASQPLWIHAGCGVGTLMHLLGHVLGLLDENQRTDREDHLELNLDNAISRYNLRVLYGDFVGAYDIDSIMHESSFAYSSDQSMHSTLPTMLWRGRLTAYDRLGWSEALRTNRTPGELAYGDFGRPGEPGNPDGVIDTLTTHDGEWEVVFGAGGRSWQTLNTAINNGQPEVDQIQMADMDGQGGTDIVGHRIDVNGDPRWHVSYGGVTGWRPLAKSGFGMDEVHVADFGQPFGIRRDARADVFAVFNNQFQVSWNGIESWQVLASACPPSKSATCLDFEDLRFGDFGSAPIGAGATPGPADGITDVLAQFDGHWQISFGGTSAWYTSRRSTIALGRLLVGDVGRELVFPIGGGQVSTLHPVADGQDDLVMAFGGRLWVSFGAQSSWVSFGPVEADISLMELGDIDGDGTDEVLSDGLISWQSTAPSATDEEAVRELYP